MARRTSLDSVTSLDFSGLDVHRAAKRDANRAKRRMAPAARCPDRGNRGIGLTESDADEVRERTRIVRAESEAESVPPVVPIPWDHAEAARNVNAARAALERARAREDRSMGPRTSPVSASVVPPIEMPESSEDTELHMNSNQSVAIHPGDGATIVTPRPIDPEIHAITSMVEQLDRLTPEQARRVMRYLADRSSPIAAPG